MLRFRSSETLAAFISLAGDVSFCYIRTMGDAKDTIPRLQHVLPHMRDQLIGLREGATFEQARERYSNTVDKLSLQGLGRRTASRVGDRDAYWAPTAEVLLEAMRLGFVERTQVPSARRYLEAHRDRTYALTALGREVSALAQNDLAAFCDQLAAAIHEAHLYFRALIEKLQDSPIACPEVSEGEVEGASREGKGTNYWAAFIAEKLSHETAPGARAEIGLIKETIVSIVRRRFGSDAESRPTGKALTQALNDAFAVAAVSAHGLPIGATDIDILKSWGSQLRILDQSRYVPGFEGFNLIWLAADVLPGNPTTIRRRDLRQHELRIAKAIIESYRAQAEVADTTLSAPYLPIYKVRADVAYRCRVTRALVDLVIERLSDGEIAEIGVQVRLHLGTTHQPVSEPLYRRGGSRRYELTIHPKSN
jgi:hypothetical protein